MTDTANLEKTPLWDAHKRAGAKLVPFAGWEMPIQYSGVSDEHRAVRNAAGLFDVCHMGELRVRGPRAFELVQRLITNDLARAEDGQAQYTCACNDKGTILDDLIVYRHRQDDLVIVCNASNLDKIRTHVMREGDGVAEVVDESAQTALIALQGPNAFAILGELGPDAARLAELKSFRFREASLGGARATVARTGYTGEDGVEIFCAAEDALSVWDALMERGAAHGLVPAGLGARDTLRLEARLSLYGNEIDETTNPLEAGLGWVVKLDKADFMGRDALMKIKEEGVSRKLVGFEMVGRGIARSGYPILDGDGERVGVCTSGSPGPTVGKNIGLGYVPVNLATVDTKLTVDCRGRAIEAVVVKTPFYKR